MNQPHRLVASEANIRCASLSGVTNMTSFSNRDCLFLSTQHLPFVRGQSIRDPLIQKPNCRRSALLAYSYIVHNRSFFATSPKHWIQHVAPLPHPISYNMGCMISHSTDTTRTGRYIYMGQIYLHGGKSQTRQSPRAGVRFRQRSSL